MIKEMDHLSFTVSNLDRSILFYRDTLGMKLVKRFEAPIELEEKLTGYPGANLHIAFLEIPGQRIQIELIEWKHPKGRSVDTSPYNPGAAHVCFYVTDDLNHLYGELKAKGVKFSGKPVKFSEGPDKGKTIAYAADPDGITVELIQPPSDNLE